MLILFPDVLHHHAVIETRHLCKLVVKSTDLPFHYKDPTQRVGLEQSGPYHLLIENLLVLAMI
jgi:hypothetical protein